MLTGGAGNDWLKGGAGADTLDGGDGRDRAIYAGSDAGVTVNLATGIGQVGHAEGDVVTDIEHLTGSGHADRLTGDDGNNQLKGGAGNDLLKGGAGRDTLDGGAGSDRLAGDAGADVFVFRPADGVTIFDFFVFNPTDGFLDNTIADFEDGTDSIRIHGSSFGDLTITDSGDDASVTWGDGNALTFQGRTIPC